MGSKSFDSRMARLAVINGMVDFVYVQHDAPGVCNELAETKTPLEALIEQEEIFVKENKYRSLSAEAKQVIEMVLKAPAEILSIIASPTTHKISKIKIERMLHRQWRDKKYARKVVAELEDYVKVLHDH